MIITDNLPAEVTLVSTEGCLDDPNGIPTCSLGSVTARASPEILITVTVDAAFIGLLSNTASVMSSTPESNPGDEIATETTVVFDPIFLDEFESADRSEWHMVGTDSVPSEAGIGLMGEILLYSKAL